MTNKWKASPMELLISTKMTARKHGGFTLIELLLVMTLLGIFVAAALPGYQDLAPEAGIAATQANLHTLRSAVTLYGGKTGGFPANLDSLVSKGFLREVPKEMMTNSNRTSVDPSGNPDFKGGWVYFSITGDVKVNINRKGFEDLISGSSANPYEDW